jgi:hypothetical protein
MNHSVNFTRGQNIEYDFIQLDLSFSSFGNDPEFLLSDSVVPPPSDALADLYHFQSDFNSFFWVRPGETSNEFKYLFEGWPEVGWSQAWVSADSAVNGSDVVAKDYVRSVVKELLGTSKLMGLFRNSFEMVRGVQALDTTFNRLVRDQAPPEAIDRLLRMNTSREDKNQIAAFLDTTQQAIANYVEDYSSTLFYYYQPSTALYFFPLRVQKDERWCTPMTFHEVEDQTFYASPTETKAEKRIADLAGLVDYTTAYVRPWVPLEFQTNDILAVRIQYNTEVRRLYERDWNPRSYRVKIHMSPPQCLQILQGTETDLYDDKAGTFLYTFSDLTFFFFKEEEEGGPDGGGCVLSFNGRVLHLTSADVRSTVNLVELFPGHVMEQNLRRVRTLRPFQQCFFSFKDGRFACTLNMLSS